MYEIRRLILKGISYNAVYGVFTGNFLVTPIYPLFPILNAPNRVYFVSGPTLIGAFLSLEPSLRSVRTAV